MALLLGGNSILIWALMITCFSSYMHSANSLARFPKIKPHNTARKKNVISFLAVGDWGRRGEFNQSRVAYQMGRIGEEMGTDFVISTGDNFYDRGLTDVKDPLFQQSFTEIYTAKSLQVPWYAVLGNHDYMGNTKAQLGKTLQNLDKRWLCKRNFVVETGGVVDIVFIDTTPLVDQYFINHKRQKFDWRDVLPREQYLTFIKNNLDRSLKNSKAQWKIVVGHHTIRSIGHHGDTKEIVEHILPILEENKVKIYINGHDHCLEHLSNRESTIHFFTSGGGSKAWKNHIHREDQNSSVKFYHDGQGFLAVTLKKKKAKLAFFDVMGNILHSLVLGQ